MPTRVTRNGLKGEQWEVVLVANVRGYQVLWLQTDTVRREVLITPKGRKIEVGPPERRGAP